MSAKDNQIIVGNGNGEIIFIDSKNNFSKENRLRLHSDCVTDILIEQNQIITTSYDGTVIFTDQRLMKPFKTVELPNIC